MFAGIVETLGTVVQLTRQDGNLRLSINPGSKFLNRLSSGSSVSIAGVCLTVVRLDANSFCVEVSPETQACTTLSDLREGHKVNIEDALKLGEAVGGHLVSGHVDTATRIAGRTPDCGSERFQIEMLTPFVKFIVPKGAVCLDGVSLTVGAVSKAEFEVNIIPYTLENTTFSSRKTGDRVNLEVDLIARYVASSLAVRE